MKYIKKLISTLASVNYYSSGYQLDDHLYPTYLQFVTHDPTVQKKPEFNEQKKRGGDYSVGESQGEKSSYSKMNNSYP